VETTASPPSSANDVTQSPSFEAVIDTTDVSVFGKHFYDVIDLADFTDEVSAALGSTTWDTGWQLMPAEYSCTLNSAYRTMWWGDVRLTFETGAESPDTYFTAWSVGDPSVSFSRSAGSTCLNYGAGEWPEDPPRDRYRNRARRTKDSADRALVHRFRWPRRHTGRDFHVVPSRRRFTSHCDWKWPHGLHRRSEGLTLARGDTTV
jgi:hypothetical protein